MVPPAPSPLSMPARVLFQSSIRRGNGNHIVVAAEVKRSLQRAIAFGTQLEHPEVRSARAFFFNIDIWRPREHYGNASILKDHRIEYIGKYIHVHIRYNICIVPTNVSLTFPYLIGCYPESTCSSFEIVI